jgi:hypothetical protein
MSGAFIVALPLLATLGAALLAAVPVGLMSEHVPRKLPGYATLVQFSLVGLAVVVAAVSSAGADACSQDQGDRIAVLWIGAGAALVGGLVIAASLVRRSQRGLIAVAVVLPYVVAGVLVSLVAPCLN